MLGKVAIWMVQRICELVLGAGLALVIFGANTRGGEFGALEDFRQNLYYVLFFFVSSGYLVTTGLFGVFSRAEGAIVRSLINTGLFVAHASAFIFFTGHYDLKRMVLLVLFGACAVAFSSLVGESLRIGLRKAQAD